MVGCSAPFFKMAFCATCGAPKDANARFCASCGADSGAKPAVNLEAGANPYPCVAVLRALLSAPCSEERLADLLTNFSCFVGRRTVV